MAVLNHWQDHCCRYGLEAKLAQAAPATLETWAERVLEAPTLVAVFAES